jgi:hypothetical protein
LSDVKKKLKRKRLGSVVGLPLGQNFNKLKFGGFNQTGNSSDKDNNEEIKSESKGYQSLCNS